MAKTTKTAKETELILIENMPSKMTGVSPRDSDKELIIQVLQRHRHADFTAEQLTILRGINLESIVRYRRAFQAAGLYQSSKEVAKNRLLKSLEIQQVAPGETPEGIQRRLEVN